MKKLVIYSMIFILIMLSCMPAFAVKANQILLSENGLELVLLEWEIQDRTDNPSIYLKFIGKNDKDERVWFDLKDAKVDGVPILSSTRSIDAHTEIKESDPITTSVWADKEDGGRGAEAILNGKKLEMDVKASGGESYKTYATAHVTINLTKMEEAGKKQTTDTNIDSGKNYAPAYTPKSTNYTGLKQGSTGQAVKDLQQRLWDLGYYRDSIDGKYGTTTAIAVMSFCTQNGLYIQGDATAEMQTALYSAGAEYYEEPWVPLMIGPEYRWENPYYVDLDNGSFYIQLVNRGDRTIRGYELYYYLTDVWGNRYVEPTTGRSITSRTTMQQTIKPGYYLETPPITVYPFAWTYTFNVAIHKVVFDDGEVREVPEDELLYFPCVIKN